MNQVAFSGRLVERKPLRVNPSGHASLECILWHESSVTEAGQSRRLSYPTAGIALGSVAERLAALAPNACVRVKGFLAPRRGAFQTGDDLSLKPAALNLHITDFVLENPNHVPQVI
ncbi:MAG: primosomal replication protein N [Betaproteobacteria bacterium]|nr:primosomal replication protein N [Betaproteobacteria bacterium]